MDFCTLPFDNAAHALYKWEKRIGWTRLADGVDCTFAGMGLYVVRELHDDAPPRFSFYGAKNEAELRAKYYGDRNE